jgi:TonB family protein
VKDHAKQFIVSALLSIFALSHGEGAVALASAQQSNNAPKVLLPNVPSYPPLARAACVQGTVAVVVEVNALGIVVGTDILYGHPLLRRGAEEAARKWVFETAASDVKNRREVLKFSFRVMPFETPLKRLKTLFITPTEVEVRSHPAEPSCQDCSPAEERRLRKGDALRSPRNILFAPGQN